MELLGDFLAALESNEITLETSVYKLVVSIILGGVVGVERRRKGQMAGVRTFALICMGSTLAVILSIYIPQVYIGLKNGDPSRIAAQIITGVGFLGAGTIIQTRGSIRGLTTAAGIWMVAAIGMSVGVGLYWVSFLATLLVLFTLVSLGKYEHRAAIERMSKIIKVECAGLDVEVNQLADILKKEGVDIQDMYVESDYVRLSMTINFVVLMKTNTDIQKLFAELKGQRTIEMIALQNELNK